MLESVTPLLTPVLVEAFSCMIGSFAAPPYVSTEPLAIDKRTDPLGFNRSIDLRNGIRNWYSANFSLSDFASDSSTCASAECLRAPFDISNAFDSCNR